MYHLSLSLSNGKKETRENRRLSIDGRRERCGEGAMKVRGRCREGAMKVRGRCYEGARKVLKKVRGMCYDAMKVRGRC